MLKFAMLWLQVLTQKHQFRWDDRKHDRTDVGFTPNVLPTQPKKQRRQQTRYTPGT